MDFIAFAKENVSLVLELKESKGRHSAYSVNRFNGIFGCYGYRILKDKTYKLFHKDSVQYNLKSVTSFMDLMRDIKY